jgi:hypothetical protein
MTVSNEDKLLGSLNPVLKPLGFALHQQLLEADCTSYVKTIYIGYDFDGVMVAALYPHHDRVEIALALPDDYQSDLLIDATHLTWKTLPVAAVVRSIGDMEEVLGLVSEACHRVATGSHDVERPNEYFSRSRPGNNLGVHRPFAN